MQGECRISILIEYYAEPQLILYIKIMQGECRISISIEYYAEPQFILYKGNRHYPIIFDKTKQYNV